MTSGSSSLPSAKKLNGGSPPPLPRITDNLTPLSVVLRRQCQYTYHELTTFLKSLESSSRSDNDKKRVFLELLLRLRQNFVRLYVIAKWADSAHAVQAMIDLFAWLMQQNQTVSNALVQLGTMKQDLVSAKIPNPDIATALEVLTQGRPQLPDHGFLPKKRIPAQEILRTLRRLNVSISTRMALEEELPRAFYSYTVKDGRATFNVPGCFQCAVSLAEDKPTAAAKTPFFLVDFKLGFRAQDTRLVPAVMGLPAPTFHHLESFANAELAKNGLAGLYELLHRYAISCKLYTLHRQLLQLRMGMWRGHLTHTYNAERSFIVVTYWLKRRAPRSTIELGKLASGELGFRWIKEGKLYAEHGLQLAEEDGSIDIEALIHRIINLHVQLDIDVVHQQLVDTVQNADKFATVVARGTEVHQLVLAVSHTKSVVYSIDWLSGEGYFENPTPLMNSISRQINSDPRATMHGLLQLRLETQKQELAGVLSTTGWQRVTAVKMSSAALVADEEEAYPIGSPSEQNASQPLRADLSNLKDRSIAAQLLSLDFYCRREWPKQWFVAVAVSGFSTRLQFWIVRMRTTQGAWLVSWAEPVEPPVQRGDKAAQYSYYSLLELAKSATSTLICHLIMKELADRGCKLKQLDRRDLEVGQFVKTLVGDSTAVSSLLLLSNKSLFAVPNARDSLVLLSTVEGHTLNVRICGKLQQSLRLDAGSNSQITSSVEGTAISLDNAAGMFTVQTHIDLADRLADSRGSERPSLTGSPVSAFPEGTSPDREASAAAAAAAPTAFLTNSLFVLKQLSGLLWLLQLVDSDHSLKLLDVSLDRVSFQYGSEPSEAVTLQVVSSQKSLDTAVHLEMPPDCPHQLCARYLDEMVAASGFDYRKIGDLVTYLKVTLPLCRAYESLAKASNQAAVLFQKQNESPEVSVQALKVSPDSGFSMSLYHFEMMEILYYKVVEKRSEKSRQKVRFRCNLKVELRHKLQNVSLNGSVYVITVVDPYADKNSPPASASSPTVGSPPQPALDESLRTLQLKVANSMRQYFSGAKPVPLPVGNEAPPVVYLKNSIVCSYSCLGEVVSFLHKRLQEVLM